jgi:hypothetical protein
VGGWGRRRRMVRRGEEEDAKGESRKGEEENVFGKKRNRLLFFCVPSRSLIF